MKSRNQTRDFLFDKTLKTFNIKIKGKLARLIKKRPGELYPLA